MKLKYFLAALIAASSFALTTVSCDDEDEKSYLSEVQVTSSYVALPVAGGSQTIEVKASGAWSFENVPDWLTVSPMSGSGNASVTFTAAESKKTNEATVLLVCGGATQRINVLQMAEKTELTLSTCAQVNAGLDGTTFRVGGTVTKIAEFATYGNFYINDGTGEVYIYGTKYQGQTKQGAITKLGIEVGDEVIVEGPKTTYNGTVELVDVDVITVNKSLIKCDSTMVADVVTNVLPLEGGVLTACITCKGNGVSVDVLEAAQEWLSVIGVSNKEVKFRASANQGGDRSVTVVLHTTDGKKDYTTQVAISQKGAIVECSVADFLAAPVGDTQYRVTGIISSIAKAEYGNIYIRDFSGEAYVYGVGAKGDFEKLGLKVGDIVTLVGKRGEYKGSAQMTGAQYESSKSVTAVTIDEFLAKADDPNTYYMVSGTIDEVANATFGNLYLKSGDSRLYVYGCYPGYGATGDARKNLLETLGITVGDELTVIGVKSTYKDVPQVNGGLYFSHKKAE